MVTVMQGVDRMELVGQRLGQYFITGEIGSGGMATVFLARQESVGRDVALKVMSRPLAHANEYVDRFMREVEIISHLQHPHILPIYDFGEQDQFLYIVMGYLGGGTLTQRIAAGPVPLDEAARYVRQIASALDYAHAQGVIHRDIKPSNVLLDAQGNAYVVDFGLAKAMEQDSNLTGQSILGTPNYMCPDMLEPDTITPSVDTYALGVTLFEMLTGQVPFSGKNPLAIMMAHSQQPVPYLPDFRDDLTSDVQTVVDTAMAKSPEDRYATPGAFSEALDRVVMGGGGAAIPVVDTSQALLLTDIDGSVIFVDSYFLKLTGRPASAVRTLMNKPAYEVLGVSAGSVLQWISEASKLGQIQPKTITAADVRGTPLHLSLTGSATYDERGKCIGVDFAMRFASIEPGMAAQHLSTPSTVFDSQEQKQIEVYFGAQIEAIRVLLVRLGGPKLAQRLTEIINETAESNDWPVRMDGSQVFAELHEARIDVYRGLLAKAINYASRVMGANMVKKQVDAVEGQLGGSAKGMGEMLGIGEMLK